LNPERKAVKFFRRKYKKSVVFVIVCGFAKLILEQKFNVLRLEALKKLIGGAKIKENITKNYPNKYLFTLMNIVKIFSIE